MPAKIGLFLQRNTFVQLGRSLCGIVHLTKLGLRPQEVLPLCAEGASSGHVSLFLGPRGILTYDDAMPLAALAPSLWTIKWYSTKSGTSHRVSLVCPSSGSPTMRRAARQFFFLRTTMRRFPATVQRETFKDLRPRCHTREVVARGDICVNWWPTSPSSSVRAQKKRKTSRH